MRAAWGEDVVLESDSGITFSGASMWEGCESARMCKHFSRSPPPRLAHARQAQPQSRGLAICSRSQRSTESAGIFFLQFLKVLDQMIYSFSPRNAVKPGKICSLLDQDFDENIPPKSETPGSWPRFHPSFPLKWICFPAAKTQPGLHWSTHKKHKSVWLQNQNTIWSFCVFSDTELNPLLCVNIKHSQLYWNTAMYTLVRNKLFQMMIYMNTGRGCVIWWKCGWLLEKKNKKME